MPYEKIVTIPANSSSGQIPIADGRGGFSWGAQSGGSDASLGITGASVGQIAKVTAVDANGKPTAWEPVNMPTGGGETWVQLAEQTLAEAAKTIAVELALPTTHFIAQLWTPKIEATETPTYFNLGINGAVNNLWYYLSAKIPSKEKTAQITAEATYVGGGSWAINAYSNAGSAFGAATSYNQLVVVPIAIKSNSAEVAQSVTAEVVANDAAQYFPAGSVLRVWGTK